MNPEKICATTIFKKKERTLERKSNLTMVQFIIPFVLFLAGFLSGYLIFYRRYSVERKKSREDFLTKTLNYREFEKTLAEILQNNETHIAVSLIDLDDFKSINDNYSYQEGDQILVQLT